jgi:glycosyltransferase involved in cell wall biosynthesis
MQRNANLRVLFISPGPSISNPASGEGTRLHQLSRHLASSFDMYLLVPEHVSENPPTWITEQYSYTQWSLPFLTDLNPSFIRAIINILRDEQIDIVHASKGVCAATVIAGILTDTTVVYAAQNVEADHAQDFVDLSLPIYKRVLGPQLIPVIERLSAALADGITTVSDADRDRFIDLYQIDEEFIRAIPTGTVSVEKETLESEDAIRRQYGLQESCVAVFHGNFNHQPNREAARLINEHVAPAVQNDPLDIEFLLIGKNPPTTSASNVRSTGFVEDLYAVLNIADIAVVPIMHGGGTKTKLFDYISLHIPIVANKKALRGTDIDDSHAVILQNNVDEFAAGVIQLLKDTERRQRLSQNMEQITEEWSWDRSAATLQEFYMEISK